MCQCGIDAQKDRICRSELLSYPSIVSTEIPILRLERATESENVAKIGDSWSFAVRIGVF